MPVEVVDAGHGEDMKTTGLLQRPQADEVVPVYRLVVHLDHGFVCVVVAELAGIGMVVGVREG